MNEKKKAKWLLEKYTDKYRTLYQAIMINLDKDKATYGKESYYARQLVNPNLTILLYKEYYDKNMNLLIREEINNDEWFFED